MACDRPPTGAKDARQDQQRQIPFSDVQKHVSADDCWLVIKVSHLR